MGKTTIVVVALLAVAIAFIATRAGETVRFIGDEENPGMLDLFRSKSQNKMAKSSGSYIEKVSAFIAGSKTGQDTGMIDDYYNIVTTFYEYGWGDQFHFAQLKEGEDHDSSLARHEHDLADKMGIKSTDKVLDVGSGVGGPARSIHGHTKATITGITINEFQIDRARYHTKKANMSDKVDFVRGDFTKMPFMNATYDKVYAIEATCHATDLYDVYSEISRVLKPGGIFGTYEWLTTALTDKNNQDHVDWLHDIEFGSGLPPMHSKEDVLIAAAKSGLEVVFEHDYALDTDYVYPWYQKLDMSGISTTITHYFTLTMETLGFAEPGSTAAHAALMRAIRGLVGGGKTLTFTPMHMFVFRKI